MKLVYSIIKNGMKGYIVKRKKADFFLGGEGHNFSLLLTVKVIDIYHRI